MSVFQNVLSEINYLFLGQRLSKSLICNIKNSKFGSDNNKKHIVFQSEYNYVKQRLTLFSISTYLIGIATKR